MDIYCISPENPILKNKLGISDSVELDLAEAECSRLNMQNLYEIGFNDFTMHGLCYIHKTLFEDVYDWAGKFRVINISKREVELGGRSVWYANDDMIEAEPEAAMNELNRVDWNRLSLSKFVVELAFHMAKIWQIHPFREGNTRTVVMFFTFFVESKGYYFDRELLSRYSGYVRNSLVLASIGDNSDYSYLENILGDAISKEPSQSAASRIETEKNIRRSEYEKYNSKKYTPAPHELREEEKK